MANYELVNMAEMPAVDCPCGKTRRAFVDDPDGIASLHLVDIRADSQAHYHAQLTELYFILEGEGYMELDGQMLPVKPMTAILIKPGCWHRAVGQLRIINIPIPAFDPQAPDEHFG